jgi:hypothetical protein
MRSCPGPLSVHHLRIQSCSLKVVSNLWFARLPLYNLSAAVLLVSLVVDRGIMMCEFLSNPTSNLGPRSETITKGCGGCASNVG